MRSGEFRLIDCIWMSKILTSKFVKWVRRTDCEDEEVGWSAVLMLSLGPCPADIALHECIALDEVGFAFLDVLLDGVILLKDLW